ncbi:MAG: radical SAM protein, partial [Phycisphaerae bacterium]|nr:radical SAM protein [Phycisphaerae bacterium]
MRVALVGAELEENLALRYLHAAVVAAGHEAEIFGFHAEDQIESLTRQIIDWRADVVGLSVVFTARAREFIALANRLRAAGWAGHVTAGGHFASFHATELLSRFRSLDSIVHGEAEESLVELLAALASRPGAGVPHVPGVSARDAAGNVVAATPRANIADLDTRPWPTRPEQFHDYLGQPIANMLSGRGCYANCHFCSINAWHRQNGGPRFRLRAPECVAREMAALYHDHGVRIFNFHDDNFFLPDRAAMLVRLNELHTHLQSLGVGRIAIQVKARPPDIHADTLAVLCKIGLFRVFLGVENASVDGLRHLGRGVNREQNRRALKLLDEAGIHVCFNLLIFEPDCAEADLRENTAFMREFSTFPLNFCRTEVYSGTHLEHMLRERGLLQGDFFGYWYRIVDAKMQETFEVFREVFTPRNFTCDGTNHEAMRVDYYLHILNHFWPDRVTATMWRRVKAIVSRLNHNNGELMDAIIDHATRGQPSDRGAVIANLSRQREQFDTEMREQVQDVLAEMVQLAARRESRGWLGFAAKAAAAAGLLITTATAAPGTDSAPKPNTDPAPRPGESSLVLDGRQVAQIFPSGVAHSETAPAPTPPASQPTSQPTSQSEMGSPLNAVDASRVRLYLNSPAMMRRLADTIQKHKAFDHAVIVTVQVDSTGWIKKATVKVPPGQDNADLKADLQQALLGLEVPNIKTAGWTTTTLFLKQAFTLPDPVPPPLHPAPLERAPAPRDRMDFDPGDPALLLSNGDPGMPASPV